MKLIKITICTLIATLAVNAQAELKIQKQAVTFNFQEIDRQLHENESNLTKNIKEQEVVTDGLDSIATNDKPVIIPTQMKALTAPTKKVVAEVEDVETTAKDVIAEHINDRTPSSPEVIKNHASIEDEMSELSTEFNGL